MKAGWSFLLYELRRHIPVTVVGWSLLIVVPIIHRLVKGSWHYLSTGWAEPTAGVAAFVIAPVIAFHLASLGWAVERSQGTLRWLYARPLPATRIFLIRVLAVFTVMVVWTGVALLASGSSPSRLVALTSRWPWLAIGWLAGVGLGMGGGCLASALFQRRDTVILANVVGALILLVSVPWIMLEIAPTTLVLAAGGQYHLRIAVIVYAILLSLAFLVAGGYAMRRTPVDQARFRRALLVGPPLLVVAVAALWIMILQPLAISSHISSVRWLGEGVTLRFAGAPGLEPWIQHPVLASEDGSTQSFNRSFAMPGLVLAHPGRGLAVVREVSSTGWKLQYYKRWLVIDRRGEVQQLEIEGDDSVEPIGWSPQGTRFAWREVYEKRRTRFPRMAVMNDELQVAWVDLETPTGDYTAAWIDEDRLLVVQSMRRASAGSWWMVVRADGATALGPEMLPRGQTFNSPAFSYPVEFLMLFEENKPTFIPAPLARRANEPVVSLTSCDDETSQLVTLDTRTGELRPIPGTLRATPLACGKLSRVIQNGLVSAGPLSDGGLVWAEPVSASETRIVTMPADAVEPQLVCTVRGSAASIGGYRGTIGPWALWSDPFERHLLACQVETGEVRTIALDEVGGASAVDIVNGGVLTATGIIELS